jgi:hypothetical protein
MLRDPLHNHQDVEESDGGMRSATRPAASVGPSLVALALSLLLAAGCVQPAASPAQVAAAPTAAVPRTLDWRQSSCEAVTWSVPVTAAALQPYLPVGFEPSPPEASPAASGAATLGFRAVECSYGFGEENLLGSLQSGQVFAPVLPPSELREERFAANYEYGWDVLVASDAWRARAAAWGLPLRDGGAAVHPTAQGWTGDVAFDKVGAFSMSGRPLDSGRPVAEADTRAITLGAQGFALWDAHVTNRTVSTGVGTWTASPESWVAEVIGMTQGLATFEYQAYDLPYAYVHWPGQALGPVDEPGGIDLGGSGSPPPR